MKLRKISFSLFSGLLFMTLSLPVTAVTFEANENVSVDRPLFDDAYVIAANGEVTADIEGDLYIMGGQIVIDGNVKEDLVVGGGRVTVNGNVDGDVRVIGGQVALYGNVGDDVLVSGGQVDIGRDSVIKGSVIAGVGVLTIDGTVNEDVRGAMGVLMLKGIVNGDVIVTIEDTLKIDAASQIGGDLEYSALLETTVPTGVVGGGVVFNKFEEQSLVKDFTYAFLIQKLFSFIGAIILLGILVWMAPKFLTKGGTLARENVFRSFGVGLLSVTAAIIGFIVLMFTVVGIPFAVITFAAFLIVLYFAKLFAVAWMGSYFLNYKKPIKRGKLFGTLSLITLGYYVIGLIPFVGWLINIVLFLIGVGTMVFVKYEYIKLMRAKSMI